jgi:hypothetical protein
MSKLYEVTVVAYKVLYVEADSQEEAFEHSEVEDAEMLMNGFEHDETKEDVMDDTRAAYLRNTQPKKILKKEDK